MFRKMGIWSVPAFFVMVATALAGEVHLPEVAGERIRPERVVVTADLKGRVVASLVAEVRPQVNGIVLERRFEEGSLVVADQPLYRIDPAMYQAQLASAQAMLGKAEANLEVAEAREERFTGLVKENAVSRQEYDEVTATWKQAMAEVGIARAQVDIAAINLDYTEVRSPIAGFVGRSSVTKGALVTASQAAPLTTVQQLDPIYVDVAQSTAGLRNLKRALGAGALYNTGFGRAPMRLILEDGELYRHQGELLFSDLTVDQTTGSIMLRGVFPNPDSDLLPGMFVKAKLEVAYRDNALVIPQQALLRNPDGSAYVMVVAEYGTVEKRGVTVLRAVGNRWLTTDGLADGELVVTEGIDRIRFLPDGPPPRVKFIEKPRANPDSQ